MKIRVERCDGSIETLNLGAGTWYPVEGVHLNRITNDSFDHFFTKDGRYDGWGAMMSGSMDEAVNLIAAVEERRDIDGASKPAQCCTGCNSKPCICDELLSAQEGTT